jgi:hypothetical protein
MIPGLVNSQEEVIKNYKLVMCTFIGILTSESVLTMFDIIYNYVMDDIQISFMLISCLLSLAYCILLTGYLFSIQ